MHFRPLRIILATLVFAGSSAHAEPAPPAVHTEIEALFKKPAIQKNKLTCSMDVIANLLLYLAKLFNMSASLTHGEQESPVRSNSTLASIVLVVSTSMPAFTASTPA